MLTNPYYASTDVAELRALVDANPWATLVTNTADGLRASHYPVLLEGDEGVTLVTHVGKQDRRTLELGQHPMLVVIQGAHGYISSDWYPEGEFVPTWNHTTAHLTCSVELLSAEENFTVLQQLVRKFEGHRLEPRLLEHQGEAAHRAARGTLGLRLRVESFEMLRKLSQNKPPEVVRRLVDELRRHPRDYNAMLADDMERANAARDLRATHLQLAVTAGLRAAQRTGYRPTAFMRTLAREGVVPAVREHLADGTTVAGLAALQEGGQLVDSIEAQVVLPWFAPLFSDDEVAVARARLEALGFDATAHVGGTESPDWAAALT